MRGYVFVCVCVWGNSRRDNMYVEKKKRGCMLERKRDEMKETEKAYREKAEN